VTNENSASYQTDEQLQTVLHEPSKWVIHGRAGFALGHAVSLHEALDKSARFALSGATIAAITCLPSDRIVIFPAQINRLRKIVTSSEGPAITEMELSEAANGSHR
jgi:hypothetical protein